ncbi:MAG: ubiquinol-cytochrome C chaperone [Sphingomonadales bacterium]|nr:ubiquinol-cytochrome C chaperone [Sphingomonadales bacterium]
MSLLKSLFGAKQPNPNQALRPLYLMVIAKGRELHWYENGQVPDTLDGRFDMISSVLALVLLRMESFPELAQQSAWLTEIFVEDMDAQMREAGIGDVVIAKDMGKVMGVLGGRLGAFRGAFDDKKRLKDAIKRNIYGGQKTDKEALAHVSKAFTSYWKKLQKSSASDLMAGRVV